VTASGRGALGDRVQRGDDRLIWPVDRGGEMPRPPIGVADESLGDSTVGGPLLRAPVSGSCGSNGSRPPVALR